MHHVLGNNTRNMPLFFSFFKCDEIVKASVHGAIPEIFDRMNRYKTEWVEVGVVFRRSPGSVSDVVWPKDLDENESKD